MASLGHNELNLPSENHGWWGFGNFVYTYFVKDGILIHDYAFNKTRHYTIALDGMASWILVIWGHAKPFGCKRRYQISILPTNCATGFDENARKAAFSGKIHTLLSLCTTFHTNMTSWYRNTFNIAGLLWGESIGCRGMTFLLLLAWTVIWTKSRVSKWFETPWRPSDVRRVNVWFVSLLSHLSTYSFFAKWWI